jgi:hypothetical protein
MKYLYVSQPKRVSLLIDITICAQKDAFILKFNFLVKTICLQLLTDI